MRVHEGFVAPATINHSDRKLESRAAMIAHRFLITERSSNVKTGPIMVTTSPRATCPTACALRNSGCYAAGGPLGIIWTALDRHDVGATVANGRGSLAIKSLPDLVAAIERRGHGELWRHNQAGDLPGDGDTIDPAAFRAIWRANARVGAMGFTYTHKPVTGRTATARRNRAMIREANAAGFTVNLSADNLADADRKAKLAIAPVAVVLPADTSSNVRTPEGHLVVLCPATQRDDVTCASCKLCARRDRPCIVGFPAHGSAKGKASAIAKG